MSRRVESKNEWGPRHWDWIHLEAIWFSRAPRETERQAARQRLLLFVGALPCRDCQREAATYFARHPPNLLNSDTYQSWAWTYHNAVNARLGKRQIAFDEYRRLYADDISRADARAGARTGGGVPKGLRRARESRKPRKSAWPRLP